MVNSWKKNGVPLKDMKDCMKSLIQVKLEVFTTAKKEYYPKIDSHEGITTLFYAKIK